MNEIPRKEYPRPQFVRPDWINLNGPWSFEFDFGCSGMERGLAKSKGFGQTIQVPFCPESKLSGVEHTDFIHQIFYHRTLTIPAEWSGKRVILHFGGVDYESEIFIDGESVALHYGGSASFSCDITGYVKPGSSCDLVVRAYDDDRGGVQPRGKQSFAYQSAGCSYTRVTGIWQTVWLEPVAVNGLDSCRITPNLDDSSFSFEPKFHGTQKNAEFTVSIFESGKKVASETVAAMTGASLRVAVPTPKLWSPESPFLYDIVYEVKENGVLSDRVQAYAGMRKIHIEGDKIFLNGQPVFLRLVLDQGYYPDGIWTAPSDEALKHDIELSLAAGFNGARLHQKVFEERFHYWADKMGYLTWGESPSWGVNAFGSQEKKFWDSAFFFLEEWKNIVERDYNHPSIIAWSPANETWPIPDLAAYRRLMTAIYDETKRLDPIRPCNETSGYHHVKTDLWTVHLYRPNAEELRKALKPEDKPVFQHDRETGYHGQPYLNDEFGGFMYIPPERSKFAENTWGYYGSDLKNEDELCAKIEEQVRLMAGMPELSGFCYTQLTDVEQEQNGIYNYDRTPKVSEGKLKKAFTAGMK